MAHLHEVLICYDRLGVHMLNLRPKPTIPARQFVRLEELKPMLERLGFVNIHVDQTNTNMAFTVEEEEEIGTAKDTASLELQCLG